jgi:hypothetical protein
MTRTFTLPDTVYLQTGGDARAREGFVRDRDDAERRTDGRRRRRHAARAHPIDTRSTRGSFHEATTILQV